MIYRYDEQDVPKGGPMSDRVKMQLGLDELLQHGIESSVRSILGVFKAKGVELPSLEGAETA